MTPDIEDDGCVTLYASPPSPASKGSRARSGRVRVRMFERITPTSKEKTIG